MLTKILYEEITGCDAVPGGAENFVRNNKPAEYAIVTVYPMALKDVAVSLISGGVKNILLEKPGAMNVEELIEIKKTGMKHGSNVYVGYNRRFYESVREAKRRIEEDGGITSLNFEFTEWESSVMAANKPAVELEDWFMANSTHVVDLAFYLAGEPVEISRFLSRSMTSYNEASAFAGAGRTDRDVIFSYKANWDSAGRWSVEALTKNHKFLFEPMEKLRMQDKGSVKVYDVDINDKLDNEYKPGIYLQTKSFIDGNTDDIPTIDEQLRHAEVYEMMERNEHAVKRDGKWACV